MSQVTPRKRKPETKLSPPREKKPAPQSSPRKRKEPASGAESSPREPKSHAKEAEKELLKPTDKKYYMTRLATPQFSRLLGLYFDDKTRERKVIAICTGRRNQVYEDNFDVLTLDYRYFMRPHILADIDHPDFVALFAGFGLVSGKFDVVIAVDCKDLTQQALENLSALLGYDGILILSQKVKSKYLKPKGHIEATTYEGVRFSEEPITVFVYRQTGNPRKYGSETISKKVFVETAGELLRKEIDSEPVEVVLKFVDFQDYEVGARREALEEAKSLLKGKPGSWPWATGSERLHELLDDTKSFLSWKAEKLNSKYSLPWIQRVKDFLDRLKYQIFAEEAKKFVDTLNPLLQKYPNWLTAEDVVKGKDREAVISLVGVFKKLDDSFDKLNPKQKEELREWWDDIESTIFILEYQLESETKRERKEKSEKKAPVVRMTSQRSLKGIDLSSYPPTKENWIGIKADDTVLLLKYLSQSSKDVCVGDTVLTIREVERETMSLNKKWNVQRAYNASWLKNMIQECKARYLVIDLTLYFHKESGHANLLFVDTSLKTIDRFEPNGSTFFGSEFADGEMSKVVESEEFLKQFEYRPAHFTCPYIGVQGKQKSLEEGGFCNSFTFLVMELKALNPEISLEEIQERILEHSPEELLLIIQKYTERINEIYAELRRLADIGEELGKHIKSIYDYEEEEGWSYTNRFDYIQDAPDIVIRFMYEPVRDYITGTLVRI